MRELFAEHGVPMPKLLSKVVENPILGETVEFTEESWGFPMIGRSETHSKGRGFWLCSNTDDVQKALRGIQYRNGRRKEPATHFMEVVDAPREYRVHIFKGKSIRISEKAFADNGDKHDYTTVKPQDNVKHVRKAAKKAMKAVGLDFGAVDILADDTQCWVLEVNAAPGLGGSMPRLYAEVFTKYMRGEW
jgi:glutathione synthase/RimK-type ligase-like ATP-grasp enzyme